MRRPTRRTIAAIACLACVLAPSGAARASVTHPSAARENAPAIGGGGPAPDARGALPMAFEPNVGQTDARVRYVARGRGYTIFLTDTDVMLSLGVPRRAAEPSVRLAPDVASARSERAAGEAVRMRIAGARIGAATAEGELPGKSAYLIGDDATRWHRDVPNYRIIRRKGVYDGIDAVFYGTNASLEYDFVVAPGADPSQIRVRYEGQHEARVDERGDLVLTLAGGELRQRRAGVYQNDAGAKRPVAARYVVGGDGEVSIAVGEYDRTKPLVVDPVVEFAEFLGGSASNDHASGIALDASGAAYVVGATLSLDFPTTPGAYETGGNGLQNGFVTKIAPDGSSLVYSTYLGGSAFGYATAVAVDASGSAVVAGVAREGFPTTPGAYDTTANGGEDAFVARLSPDGSSLLFSTLLGGTESDSASDVEIGASGAIYVAGSVFPDGAVDVPFPTTVGAYNTTPNGSDGFVAKLSANGSSLVYSTYVGGPAEARGIGLGPGETAVVAGAVIDTPFSTTPGAYDTTFNDGTTTNFDGFVLRLNAAGTAAIYSTFLGGAGGDLPWAMTVDATGAAYVVGDTTSTDFPTTAGAFDTTNDGPYDAFAAKLGPDGSSLVYGTFLGGEFAETAFAVAVDASGVAYVGGNTQSDDYPTTPGAYDTNESGTIDGFVTKLAANGQTVAYSTLLGGIGNESVLAIGVDASGAAYVAGSTGSPDFPRVGSPPSGERDDRDGFVTKIAPSGATLAYSATIGGVASLVASSNQDSATDVAVDGSGAIYLTGFTTSLNFPVTPGAVDTSFNYAEDAFVTKVTSDASSIVSSTYLGGSRDDEAAAIVVDATGAAFVTGFTLSDDFPTTPGAFDPDAPDQNFAGNAWVAKLAPDGASLVYGTYLAGGDTDSAVGIAIDATGAAYVSGTTSSTDFPTTPGAFDTTHASTTDSDAFVAKLAPDGASLVYATYLGGAGGELARDVAIDAAGTAFVIGETNSADFPTTPGAFDTTFAAGPTSDAFVTRVSANGSSLAYSTYVGGTRLDAAYSVAVDGSSDAYVVGVTSSLDFPTTPGAYDVSWNGATDAFLLKLNPAGSSLVFSTYLGGNGDEAARGVALGAGGAVHVVGVTDSPAFPTTPDGFQLSPGEFGSAFVTEFDTTGARRYSTYFGGDAYDSANAVAADPSGAVVFAGVTGSSDLFATGFGHADFASAFVAKLRLPAAGAEAADSPGVYVAATGAWFLRNSNSAGGADVAFTYGGGGAGLVPITGDWDGDGDDTPGLYAPATGAFFLKNTSSGGGADLVFTFGAGGSAVPLVGDWNGDGTDTVGLYDPATGAFFLTNANAGGGADLVFTFGLGGAGVEPVTGDWNGDGADTVGLYVAGTGTFFLRNANGSGPADLAFSYGPANATPLVGDWNGDGIDTAAIYVGSTGAWFLRDANSPGGANTIFTYGPTGVVALSGDWDGL